MRNNQQILFTGEMASREEPRGLHWHARDWLSQAPFRDYNGQVGQVEWIPSELYEGAKDAYLYTKKLTMPYVPEHVDQTGKPDGEVLRIRYRPGGRPEEPPIVFHASAKVQDLLGYTPAPYMGFRTQIRAMVSHYTDPAYTEITASTPIFKVVDSGNSPIIEVSQERRVDDLALYVTVKYYPDASKATEAEEKTFKIPGSEETSLLPQDYQIQATEGQLLVTAGTYTVTLLVHTNRSLFKETKFRFFHEGGNVNVGMATDIYDIVVFPFQRAH